MLLSKLCVLCTKLVDRPSWWFHLLYSRLVLYTIAWCPQGGSRLVLLLSCIHHHSVPNNCPILQSNLVSCISEVHYCHCPLLSQDITWMLKIEIKIKFKSGVEIKKHSMYYNHYMKIIVWESCFAALCFGGYVIGNTFWAICWVFHWVFKPFNYSHRSNRVLL